MEKDDNVSVDVPKARRKKKKRNRFQAPKRGWVGSRSMSRKQNTTGKSDVAKCIKSLATIRDGGE